MILYGLILESAGKISNNSKVLEEPLHHYYHTCLYNLLSLYQHESRVGEIKTDYNKSYKSLIRKFQKGNARFLNNAEFADFLKMFPQVRESEREGLKQEDLVQKVEHLEQITTTPAS